MPLLYRTHIKSVWTLCFHRGFVPGDVMNDDIEHFSAIYQMMGVKLVNS
jgi:hypothetical protein